MTAFVCQLLQASESASQEDERWGVHDSQIWPGFGQIVRCDVLRSLASGAGVGLGFRLKTLVLSAGTKTKLSIYLSGPESAVT